MWPFSLQKDGFWEKKIGEPFALRDRGALELLRSLIKVVMIRHSKSQVKEGGEGEAKGNKNRRFFSLCDSVAVLFCFSSSSTYVWTSDKVSSISTAT